MSTTITVLPAYRAGAGMIGVAFGQPPIARMECESKLETIARHVETIRETYADKAYKITYRHDRKPRGWDTSDLKWKTDNLPEPHPTTATPGGNSEKD
jgi:hypothetical protein